MRNAYLAELASGVWAMEPRALEAFLGRLEGLASLYAERAFLFDEEAPKKRTSMSVENGVATIPIVGVLMKKVPSVFRWMGIEATGYGEIVDNLKAAVGDDAVKSIVLRVSSPGGQVAGVGDAADAIHEARGKKNVSARIEEIGASGAYWLASQASTISAGAEAMVGSIGVYATYIDSSKLHEELGIKVHVVKFGDQKAMGVPGVPITQEQLDSMQAVINGMGALFVEAVARGRKTDKKSAGEWATGAVWIAREAKDRGLIDAVGKDSKQTVSSGGRTAAISIEKEENMADPKQAADGADEIRANAAKEAREAEQKRLRDLKAAFPEDPAFAFEQFEKGSSVEQAKVAYSDVLQVRLKAETAKRTELEAKIASAPSKPAPAPAGASPMTGSVDPSTASGEDFMTAARAYAREHGVKMTAAMSAVAKSRPDLFTAHAEKAIAEGPAHAARKKEFGVR